MRLPSFRLSSIPLPASVKDALSNFPKLRSVEKNPLPLLRSIPPTRTAFVTTKTALFRQWASPARHFLELRADALLLYPVSDLLVLYRDQLRKEGLSVTNIGVSQLEALPHDSISKLAGLVNWKRVMTFVLPITNIVVKEQSMQIVLRSSRQLSSTALCLLDRETVLQWKAAFASAMEVKGKHLHDFQIIRYLGEGASGTVYLVEEKETRKKYALKVIEKTTVYESDDSYRHALDERLVLEMTRAHPYVLNLRYAFQNSKRLFLITEYCPGGDLFNFMERRVQPMKESMARDVAAEILLGLEHIHQSCIVYRDLKLENILLDADGHIRIADFGLAKILKSETGESILAKTFCGTREYVAPEMLFRKEYDTTLDLWTYGVLVYEMLTGKTPFYTEDHSQIYNRIEKAPVFYPHDMSPTARDFLEKLLRRNPTERLGAQRGFEEIKSHPWFEHVDWEELRWNRSGDGPLVMHSNQIRSFTERTAPYVSTPHNLGRKSRREIRAERAMARLLQDAKEDLELVEGYEKRLNALRESSGSSVATRIRSPSNKRYFDVVAGYSFCGEQS